LAAAHGIRNVAVLEKNYLGSGNAGRNTTIIRSSYSEPANVPFYEASLKAWEGLEEELNYNVMVSQRGVLHLFHSDVQRDAHVYRANMMRLCGVDCELLDPSQVHRLVPHLDFDNARFRILGATYQPRGGTVRHDAVVWGYARAADRLGVHLIQNCEVAEITTQSGRACGVRTNLGFISASKVGIVVAGNSSQLAAMIELKLPIESHVLQAFVTEPIKPMLNHVVMFGAGHLYISQSDKGGLVFGGSIDGYNSYAQRGNLPQIEETAEEAVSMLPILSRLRISRHWGGIMDMSMDGSPIIDRTHVDGVYINCGWCYGGFKATPASGSCFAHTIAHDEVPPLARSFSLARFASGHLINEHGTGPQPNLH
jgi:sarcosine oxidase subunit beta